MKVLIADFALINAAAASIAVLGSLFGRDFLNTFVYVTFLLSGVVLVAGGYLGFFASSASLSRLFSSLRLKKGIKDERKISSECREKPEKRGLRTVVLGIALLFESVGFALLMA